MRKPVFGGSDQVPHKPGFRKKRDCTIHVAKTKALISFAVTAKLICVFVFAYAKSRFSHNEAHICICAPRFVSNQTVSNMRFPTLHYKPCCMKSLEFLNKSGTSKLICASVFSHNMQKADLLMTEHIIMQIQA